MSVDGRKKAFDGWKSIVGITAVLLHVLANLTYCGLGIYVLAAKSAACEKNVSYQEIYHFLVGVQWDEFRFFLCVFKNKMQGECAWSSDCSSNSALGIRHLGGADMAPDG